MYKMYVSKRNSYYDSVCIIMCDLLPYSVWYTQLKKLIELVLDCVRAIQQGDISHFPISTKNVWKGDWRFQYNKYVFCFKEIWFLFSPRNGPNYFQLVDLVWTAYHVRNKPRGPITKPQWINTPVSAHVRTRSSWSDAAGGEFCKRL